MAGSGHIDIVGALFLIVSAAALVRRWRAIAALAFGLAVAVKFLPIVLLPLYWKRIRIRDAALATAMIALLYLPFLSHGRIPTGSLATYLQTFRFNGPVFAALDHVAPSQLLAGFAVLVGLVTATWLRCVAPAGPAYSFAWPMAASLFFGPVVFPWYLLWLLPFLSIGHNAADHPMDDKHYSHVRSVALAYTWTSLGGTSWLDHAARIRLRGSGRRNLCTEASPFARSA